MKVSGVLVGCMLACHWGGGGSRRVALALLLSCTVHCFVHIVDDAYRNGASLSVGSEGNWGYSWKGRNDRDASLSLSQHFLSSSSASWLCTGRKC